VDMRLRPFGDSGPLVSSFAALESYYQEQGREWERYALLKARPLAEHHLISHAERQQHQYVMQLLKPFVYRRYIDFSVIESLRTMKQQIRSEVQRRGLKNNIKLGEGGIREVEFIVQALQILRGGKEPQLQQASLLKVLPELEYLNVFSASEAQMIKENYLWLRDCEQVLQAIDDKQTQTLPEDPIEQHRLMATLEVSSWTEFLDLVEKKTCGIRALFDEIIGEPEQNTQAPDPKLAFWQQEWRIDPQVTDSDRDLDKDNLPVREQLALCLQQEKPDLLKSVVTSKGRDKLDRLIPVLLTECEQQKVGNDQLKNVLKVIKRIAARTTYLTLLVENPKALSQLVKLVSSCHFIGNQLQRFPMLLDQLIDPVLLYSPPNPQDYHADLQRNLLRVDPDDLELQMEILRQFKLSSQLIVAACDVAGVIDLTGVSDRLTALAEAILDQVVNISWRQMVDKYGLPDGATEQNKNFAVIGYGKLGGYELGYGSDLDIVFVHDCNSHKATDGPKAIDSRQFYLKLAQRIMHICTTRTATGVLYDVDTRLRPSGASGLLAININTFVDYQLKEAWTWEHQALVRARVVLGKEKLCNEFNEIRTLILCKKRSLQDLISDISTMRLKMQNALSKETENLVDLKQSRGGIADIEFITQFLILAYAHDIPELAVYSDNKRQLEHFVTHNLLNAEDRDNLWRAYHKYRVLNHQCSLNLVTSLVPKKEIMSELEKVKRLWTTLNLN
jgi:[glutamine synthetase] adenylyltransferase / [glutamine synthetase]-adenylyl-L-tyrosine phosphorylase